MKLESIFSLIQLFFLVVVFGMFHGVVYLPIILSFVGPQAYGGSTTSPHDNKSNGVEMEVKPMDTKDSKENGKKV